VRLGHERPGSRSLQDKPQPLLQRQRFPQLDLRFNPIARLERALAQEPMGQAFLSPSMSYFGHAQHLDGGGARPFSILSA
jgi:hypothetical protein